MSNPKVGFYLNLFFAILNLYFFFSAPLNILSILNLGCGLLCAYGAYRLKQYA